jgi:hypothetical protein
MMGHIARWPRVRDRTIYVGEPDDIVPDDFGPGLPAIRAWTEEHFAFSGSVLGSQPLSPAQPFGTSASCWSRAHDRDAGGRSDVRARGGGRGAAVLGEGHAYGTVAVRVARGAA